MEKSEEFGVLTLATKNDFQKAIGLALSLDVSNPGVKRAVACSTSLTPLVEPYFDYIIPELNLKGFRHKVHIDVYTPFRVTFFFDSDVLVFRPLEDVLGLWKKQPFIARGRYERDGFSAFSLDRKKVLEKIGKKKLVCIDGAGHSLYRYPECIEIFELARQITEKHHEYCGNIRYADEDVMDIAMTILDYEPVTDDVEFFSRYCSAKKGTMKLDAVDGICQFMSNQYNRIVQPYMMHFAAYEAPLNYHWQLFRLFRKYNVSTQGLFKNAIKEFYVRNIHWPIYRIMKRLKIK